MLTEFGRVFLFILVGAGFVAIGLAFAGDTRIRFNVRFYVIALVFLIFDVEVVFLFPWAVVYGALGWFAFFEMLVFLAILLVGYAYVWRKGDLDWDKPAPNIPRYERGFGVRESPLTENEIAV
ncbi:MAG: NADH-ubiquinone/plastoquinone oxidoreductase chain 3 [Bacteroidetes bacterium]|nr:NADH-ubiquinone/plastoquinone oxidoreductase chain 3 [Bacteroidota bacterium]